MKRQQDPYRAGFATWMFGIAAWLGLGLGLLMRASAVSIWDDAWFYARYGHNLLAHGAFQWNPGTRAYGLTAPIQGMLSAAGQATGLPPGLVLFLLSLLPGLLMLSFITRAIHRDADDGGEQRGLLRDGMLLLTAMNAPFLAAHLSSGMETMLAMAYLLGYLGLLWAFVPRLSPGRALVLGVAGGLAWVIRPELLVFTLGVPAGLILLGARGLSRRASSYALLFTFAAMLAMVWGCMKQFGSVLPLSFHAKVAAQSSAIASAYRYDGLGHLAAFLGLNILPAGAVVLAAIRGRRLWWRFLLLHERLLLGALVAFLLAETLLVLPVMGYHARLLYPCWPVLVWLGARSAVFLLRSNPAFRTRLLSLLRIRWAVALIALAVAAGGLGLSLSIRMDGARTYFMDFRTEAAYAGVGRGNWPLLDQLATLPDSVRIASTELGILGMLRPDAEVIDLSGLHDPILAHEGFSADRLFRTQRPHWIFLPLPDYQEMRSAILSHPDTALYQRWLPEGAFTEVMALKGGPAIHLAPKE